MANDSDRVVEVVRSALGLRLGVIGPESSMETVAEWDSLAQLKVCMHFQDAFRVEMGMDEIASATSVRALLEVLQRSGASGEREDAL